MKRGWYLKRLGFVFRMVGNHHGAVCEQRFGVGVEESKEVEVNQRNNSCRCWRVTAAGVVAVFDVVGVAGDAANGGVTETDTEDVVQMQIARNWR